MYSRKETLEGHLSYKKDADAALMPAYESLNSFKPEVLKMVASFAGDKDIIGVNKLLIELVGTLELVLECGSSSSKSDSSGSDSCEDRWGEGRCRIFAKCGYYVVAFCNGDCVFR